MLPRILLLLFALLPAITGCYLSTHTGMLSGSYNRLWVWVGLVLFWGIFLFSRYRGTNAKAPMMFTLAKDTIIAFILSGILTWALPSLGLPLLTDFHTRFGQQGWVFLIGLAALILLYYLSYALFQQNNSHGWQRLGRAFLSLAYPSAFICLTYAQCSNLEFFLISYLLIETYVICWRKLPATEALTHGNDITDLLGREKVVRDCIERLKTPKKRTGEASNLALTGSWGSGKTFIMKLVHHELQKDPDVHVIPLNLWHLQTLADIHKAVIQAIHSTVRGSSCFSSPALLWCLRSITRLCDAQTSTRFSEALERLVLNPGSMHTAGDVAALNAALRKPIIIFLDDLERLNKNVLEQVLPMIDSLSQVNNLRFFVAINTETFNEFKTTRTEAAGYFHKVFTDHIEIPSFQEEYYVDYVHHFLNTNKVDSTSKDMIISIFEAPPLDEGVGISAYHPCKIRTLVHSLHALVSIASSPLQELVQSTDESKKCSKILSIIHFFNCLKEEDPHFYSLVKEAAPGTRMRTIKDYVSKYLEKVHGSVSNNDNVYTRCKERDFLKRVVFQYGRDDTVVTWPEDLLEDALGVFLYSTLNMTNDQVRHMVNEAMENKGIVEPNGNTETGTKAIISIFWNKLITIMLSHAEAPQLSVFQTLVENNPSQIENNKHSIIKKLDTYMNKLSAPLSEGRQKAIIQIILLNLRIGDATSFYESQRLHKKNDGLQDAITDRICFFL